MKLIANYVNSGQYMLLRGVARLMSTLPWGNKHFIHTHHTYRGVGKVQPARRFGATLKNERCNSQRTPSPRIV